MAKTARDILLEDILPSSIGIYQEVLQAARAIDPDLHYLSGLIGQLPIYSRIDELPSDWLDHLAWQWHADVYEPVDLSLEQKRYIAKTSLMIHRYKGTRWAITTALRTLGFQRIDIQEHWQLDSKPYTFAIQLAPLNEALVHDAKRFIEAYKPARSQLISLDLKLYLNDEEQAEDKFSAILSPQLSDTVPLDDGEQFSAVIQPFFNESPWFRHYYGEENLFYDGKIRYDSQDEEVEFMKARVATQIEDVVESRERTITTIKIIV